MATQACELYESITGQLFEIGRQLHQQNGYPFNPKQLKDALQNAIEGKFGDYGYLIDCDADPFIPSDWSVDEHQKGGQIQFDSSKIELWLAKDQQKSKSMEGNKLRKELQSRKVLNANVLDYLLAHPELIPEEWKGKCLFFWGTIYRRSNGHLYVRFLYWFGDRWRWVGGWLDDGWRGNDPAVLSAS